MASEDEADEDADRPPEQIGGTVVQRDTGFAIDEARGLSEGVFVLKQRDKADLPPILLWSSSLPRRVLIRSGDSQRLRRWL